MKEHTFRERMHAAFSVCGINTSHFDAKKCGGPMVAISIAASMASRLMFYVDTPSKNGLHARRSDYSAAHVLKSVGLDRHRVRERCPLNGKLVSKYGEFRYFEMLAETSLATEFRNALDDRPFRVFSPYELWQLHDELVSAARKIRPPAAKPVPALAC